MGLKCVIDLDDIEDVGEAQREFYKKGRIKTTDGSEKEVYVLDIENVDGHPQVFSLRDSRRKDREKIADLEKKNRELADKVVDLPEEFSEERWDELIALEADRKANPNPKVEEAVAAALEREKAKHEQALARKDRDIKKIADEKAELSKRLGEAETRERKSLVNSTLSEALDKAGVKPVLRKAARAMLEQDIIVVEEDGVLQARMKDALGGDPVESYIVNIWAGSDDGKAFIEPPSGSGARGSQGNGSVKNPWDPKSRNFDEQTKLFRTDPEKARRLAKEHGVVL